HICQRPQDRGRAAARRRRASLRQHANEVRGAVTAMLGAVAAFERTMRIGSLEITAALAVVALLAARPRVRAAAEIGALSPMQVDLEILERGVRRSHRGRPPL